MIVQQYSRYTFVELTISLPSSDLAEETPSTKLARIISVNVNVKMQLLLLGSVDCLTCAD